METIIIYGAHIKDTVIIENVKRRALKLIPGFGDLCYDERLRRLDLPYLRYRRKRGDLIQFYKNFH